MFLDNITDESVKKHGFKVFQIFSVLFLIFSIPLGSSINQVFAEELPDVYRGYDYLDVANPDNPITKRYKDYSITDYGNMTNVWKSQPEFVEMSYVGNLIYVPYKFDDSGNQITVEAGKISFVFDKTTCEITKMWDDNHPDEILLDKVNYKLREFDFATSTWSDAIHNDLECIISETLQGVDIVSFTTQQGNTSVGIKEIEYVTTVGKGLETFARYYNLNEEKTNHKYGFIEEKTQPKDVQIKTDADLTTMKGSTIELTKTELSKSLDGLIENEIIEFEKNGVKLIYNSKNIIHDALEKTVIDESDPSVRKISTEFTDISKPLGYGEMIEIDPTFSSNSDTTFLLIDADNDDNCETAPTSVTNSDRSSGSTTFFGRTASSTANDCYRTFTEFSVSSVPDTALITDVTLTIDDLTALGDINCNIIGLNNNNQPQSTLDDTVWGYFATETVYLENDDFCTDATGQLEISLGNNAVADMQNLGTSNDWYAVGLLGYNDVGAIDGSNHYASAGTGIFALSVTYQTAPSAPTNGSASTQSSSEIDLSWTTPSSPGTGTISGYKIFNSTDGSTWNTLVNNTGTIDTTYSVTGLDSGTQFYFKVAGWNEFNLGSNSSSFNNYTLTEAPTSLTATAIDSQDEIRLLWSAPSGTVTGYKVERESPIDGGFSVLTANTGNTTTSYNNTSLDINTQYNYRISAINSGGASLASSSASNATGTIAPSATATRASPTQITITWNTPATASEITNYKIYNSTDDSTYDLLTTLGVATSYTDSGLITGQTYYYKVAGVTSWGDGANSTATSATVTANPPAQGGGGSGGSGLGGGSSGDTGVPASNALLLNLNSRSFPLNLGDVRTYSLEIIWDETKESTLFVKNIKIGQGQFDSLLIVPESLPEIGKKIVAGKGDILLTVNVPPDQCSSTQITARCVNLKTYTVPVMITVEDIIGTSYPDIPATITLVIQDKFPIGITIIILLLLSFMYPIYKIIKINSKKTRNPKNMKKYHDKILEKSKQIDHKKIKHNKNILKKIKRGF